MNAELFRSAEMEMHVARLGSSLRSPAKTAPPPPPPLDTTQALIFTVYNVHNAVLQKTQSKWVSK